MLYFLVIGRDPATSGRNIDNYSTNQSKSNESTNLCVLKLLIYFINEITCLAIISLKWKHARVNNETPA